MLITIGREHGSSGHDIARRLAQELSIRCYDKEIVDEAAAASDFSPEILSSYDEKRVSAFFMPVSHFGGLDGGFQLNMQAAALQFDTLRRLASSGSGVFVGRCADYVLRGRPELLRVFIRADLSERVRTIAERKGLSEEQAKKLIRQVDKDRASYYRYYTDQTWGDAQHYDLVINSSRTGVEGAVRVIRSYIEAVEEKR
ncbi:MAG: cytidylate kinase-like family protein [Oscillospiraceae bacterium]|nr:cytidylate kinase-like family protein [Oscillospiraceae bacterium]